MLKRKAYEAMAQWKASPSRRALLVTGARQIGKTYLVRKFAEENYDSFVEFNFALDPQAKSIFSQPLRPEDIVMRFSLRAHKPLIPGKTLIFLDEIQEAPEVLTAIKGLIDRGDYDYVLSGSLLGVELRNIRSNPVGYVATLVMHPLDFEEFCWGVTGAPEVFSYLAECFTSKAEIDPVIHEHMLDLFRKYIVVGGMPDAVKTFIESSNIVLVRGVQEDIKNWYRTDISKYCPESEKLKARDAFDLVPAELNNPNKRFILKELNQNARMRNYEEALLWLTHAQVANAAYNVKAPEYPLLASKERRLFKLFYADTGVLMSCYSMRASQDLLDGRSGVNFGSMYENVAAQEFVAHGFDMYYFNSKKHGELDFLLEKCDGEVLPIEIKSGKDYKRHRALNNVLNISSYRLKQGYVFGSNNLQQEGNVLYLPIYMLALLKRD